MKALRIKLRQASASYAMPEMVNNRMSYPLPPFSTIIGALHNACSYKEYRQMNISVQGRYDSKQREVYVNHGLVDNLHDDRGVLIWLPSSDSLSTGYITVAKALNATGNSFKDRVTISVEDEAKLQEYVQLYQIKEDLDAYSKSVLKPKKESLKQNEKLLKEKAKEGKESSDYLVLSQKVKEEKEEWKRLEEEFQSKKWREYEEPRSHFKTLTKGPQTWEILYGVELVLHVSAAEEILDDLMENRHNFVSLGRSEDFIELIEMKLVELSDRIEGTHRMQRGYTMFANVNRVEDESYFKASRSDQTLGTVYYVPKNYQVEEKKRVFQKIPCLFASNLEVDEVSSERGVYLDFDGETCYLVDLN